MQKWAVRVHCSWTNGQYSVLFFSANKEWVPDLMNIYTHHRWITSSDNVFTAWSLTITVLGKDVIQTLWQHFGKGPLNMHKARSVNTWLSLFVVEPVTSAHSSQHLWDKLECLSDALEADWKNNPSAMLQNLPRKVSSVMKAYLCPLFWNGMLNNETLL